MTLEKDSAFEKMFDTRLFINSARMAMLVGSLVGLPVAGYLAMRLIDKADRITAQVEQTGSKLDLLDQNVRFNTDQSKLEFGRANEMLRDHEVRIRGLEREVTRPLPLLPPPATRR